MPMGERGAAMADSVGLAFHPLQAIKAQAGNARRVAGGACWSSCAAAWKTAVAVARRSGHRRGHGGQEIAALETAKTT
jgi:hypothetical protein